MKKIYLPLAILAAIGTLAGCKSNENEVPAVDTALNTTVIEDFSVNIANAEYTSLAGKTATLYTQAQALSTPCRI